MARRSTPTTSDAAARFVDYWQGQGGSKGAWYSHRSLLGRLTKAVNDRQVGNLTPDHFEAFFYGPNGLAATCSRTTLARYYSDMKRFLTYCHRRGWCDSPEQLLGDITTRSTRSKRARLRLGEDELWSMVHAAENPRDAAMLVAAMHTGCRVSELRALTLRQYRPRTGEIHVRVLKTKEEDVINVGPILERYLREWLTAYHEVSAPKPLDYLFPAMGGHRFVKGQPSRRDWRTRGFTPGSKVSNPRLIIRRLADAAGVELEDGDGWHTVRRSVARIFFDKVSHEGHDTALRMTAAFLNHANVTTTEIYLGLDLEKLRRDRVMTTGFLTDPFADENVTDIDRFRESG